MNTMNALTMNHQQQVGTRGPARPPVACGGVRLLRTPEPGVPTSELRTTLMKKPALKLKVGRPLRGRREEQSTKQVSPARPEDAPHLGAMQGPPPSPRPSPVRREKVALRRLLGFAERALHLAGGVAVTTALHLTAATPDAAATTPPLLKVGHVGHDHHLALYVAALEGPRFERNYGIWLKEISPREIYDLTVSNQPIARLRFIQVQGGALMPAALGRGEIDIGLGGLTSVAKLADGGQPFKVLSPLQTGGDMLVMRKGSTVTNWAGFVAEAKAPGKPIQIGYKAAVAVAKVVFEGALKAEGIRYGYDATKTDARVILVNFASEASPVPLLESGALDGFVMNQPAAAIAAHKGAGRVVAELAELPPIGKWRDHPCCIVAATEATLRARPQVIREFLKVLLLSTELIRQDQALAIACASRWTKNQLAVEQASVPTVHYVAEPTDAWLKGLHTWADMMREMKFFSGRFAPLSSEELRQQLCDFEACRRAATELRAAGLLPRP